jgi:beta-lactamase regulating signal transducer with metallopeptidase domain
VAIAHESAHVDRHDAMWSSVVRLAAILLPATTARRLLAAHDFATERACDEAAALQVGDRLLVADAILRAKRLGLRHRGDLVLGFAPDHWSGRVEALLQPATPAPTGWRRWDVGLVVVATVAVVLASPIHHAAESALGLVLH